MVTYRDKSRFEGSSPSLANEVLSGRMAEMVDAPMKIGLRESGYRSRLNLRCRCQVNPCLSNAIGRSPFESEPSLICVPVAGHMTRGRVPDPRGWSKGKISRLRMTRRVKRISLTAQMRRLIEIDEWSIRYRIVLAPHFAHNEDGLDNTGGRGKDRPRSPIFKRM